MMRTIQVLKARMRAFQSCEEGASTVEFVLAFPIFILFLSMTYENGMISLRHVMLERGVDIAVRDVRIGRTVDPNRQQLRENICEAALIIPDCKNQLQMEMFVRNPRAWQDIPAATRCVDRGNPGDPSNGFTNGANNELVVLRVCALFDPVMPTTGLGRIISESDGPGGNKGAYALVTTTSYVVEPFRKDGG